jgi:hypothetical protein
MSEILLIKPTKGSKKFFEQAEMFQGVMTKNPDGSMRDEGESKKLGAYNKEKFIGSKQIARVAWSNSRKQYYLGEDLSNDDLNELVKECRLPDGRGGSLAMADRFRYDDPFFQHKELYFRKEEGEGELDKANPKEKVIALNIVNRSTYTSGNADNPIMSAMAKYKITDKNQAGAMATKKVDSWMELGQLFGGLDESKMKKIAVALNLGIQQDSNLDLVKNSLHNVLTGEDKMVIGTLETYKQAFIRLCKAKTDDLDLEYKITLAKRKGFLRKKKNQGWLFNGKPTVTTDGQLMTYFAELQNQDDYFELNSLIDDTSKNTTKGARSKAKSDK